MLNRKTLEGMDDYDLLSLQYKLFNIPEHQKLRYAIIEELRRRQKKDQEEKSVKKYTETISIDKYELTAILREHYGYAEGNIMNRPWFDIIFQYIETGSEDK